MSKILITLGDDNGTRAPLFAQFDGQLAPQPAYLEFDPSATGSLEVKARYSGEIGNAVPASVWNGSIIRICVPGAVSRDWLLGLGDDEHLALLLGRIRAGEAGSDPYTGRASYTDDAQAAIEELRFLEESWQSGNAELVDVFDADDWYANDSAADLAKRALAAGGIAAMAKMDLDEFDTSIGALLADEGDMASAIAAQLAGKIAHHISTQREGSDEILKMIELLVAFDAEEYGYLQEDYNEEFSPSDDESGEGHDQ